MTKFIYPAENLQGKWNKTTGSDNSKGWKSERYIRYPTKDSIETLLGITNMSPILRKTTKLNTHFVV
jgi:hypothetical protein